MTNVVPMQKPGPKRPWTTSYSKLKNFETCPRRYYEIDISKHFKEADSEHLEWGGFVHTSFEHRLARGTPLPAQLARYEDEAVSLENTARRAGGDLRVEMKLSFDNQFRATGYFDNATWFRGKADALIVAPPMAWAIDWKTGSVKEDHAQLALMAQCVLSNYPEVDTVGTTFVWLGAGEDGACLYSPEVFTRSSMLQVWNSLWPRFKLLQQAHETGLFPPKESGLCKRYCAVTSCSFNGNHR